MATLRSEKSIFQLPPNNIDLFVDGRQTYYRSNMEFVDGILPVTNGGTGTNTFEEGNLLAYKDGTFVSSPYTETYFEDMEERFRVIGNSQIAKADGTLLERNEETGVITLPDFLSHEGGNMSGPIYYSKRTPTFLDGAKGDAFFSSTVSKGKHQVLAKFNSINGVFTDSVYYNQRLIQYIDNETIQAEKNEAKYQLVLMDESGNSIFPKKVTAESFTGDLHGEAEYAYDARALGGKSPAYYLDYVNLTNVPDDMNKPVSNAQQAAIKAAVEVETVRAQRAEEAITNTIATNKPIWDDKYTRNEVDNLLVMMEQKIDWKESVDTFEDIATTYPNPEDGWRVNVKDTDISYQYDGEKWIAVSANAIPKATQQVDGLLTKEDKISYDDANAKKHTHSNHALLERLGDTMLDKVPNVATDDQMVAFQEAPVLRELTSGEKIKVSFGKLAKGIKELIAHITNTSNPHAVTKEQLEMGNVDNTADINKPISNAQQQALNTKAPSESPILTGNPQTPTMSITTNGDQIASTKFVHDVLNDYTLNPPFRSALMKGCIWFKCPEDSLAEWKSAGGITSLPTTYKQGWVYKVYDPANENGDQEFNAYDGDLLLALMDRVNDYRPDDWMIIAEGGVIRIGGDAVIHPTSEDGRYYTITHGTKNITTVPESLVKGDETVRVVKEIVPDDCGHVTTVKTAQIPLVDRDMLDSTLEQAKDYTDDVINNLIGGASDAMDTLKEIEDVYNNHQEVADALTEAIGNKAGKDEMTAAILAATADKVAKTDYASKDSAGIVSVDNFSVKISSEGKLYTEYIKTQELRENVDLNTILLPGFYSCGTDEKAATIENCPVSYAFNLFVKYATGEFGQSAIQELTSYQTGNPATYKRSIHYVKSVHTAPVVGNWFLVGGNNYTHPTTSGNKHIPSGGSVGQILRYSADGTAAWGNETKYVAATATANGLLTSTDKVKLDGIAVGANNYVHPTTAGNVHVPAGGALGNILAWKSAGVAQWVANNAVCSQKLGRNGSNATPMTFNWSGQSGYPSWYWGGSDGTNMYVYNPLNLPFVRKDVEDTKKGNLTINNGSAVVINGGGFLSGLFSGTSTPGVNESGIWIKPSANADGWMWMGIIDSMHAFIPRGFCRFGSPNHRWQMLYIKNIESTGICTFETTRTTLAYVSRINPLSSTTTSVINNFQLKNCQNVATSDRRKKKDIASIDRENIKSFLKELIPVWYRLISDPDKIRSGLIAQDVEPLIEKYHLPKDWNFFYKEKKKDDNGNIIENEYDYGLNYEQLIIPMLLAIQDLL